MKWFLMRALCVILSHDLYLQARKRRKMAEDDDSSSSSHDPSKPVKYYLKLADKEHSSCYAKDDIWILSQSDMFQHSVCLCRSLYHGPSSNGIIELALMSKATGLSCSGAVTQVSAIRGPNAGQSTSQHTAMAPFLI